MEKQDCSRLKVLIVTALLLISTVALAFIIPVQSGSSTGGAGSQFDDHTITYHSNNGMDLSYSVDYSGIASSEYNPEYWAGSFSDNGGATVQNWVGEGSPVSLTFESSASFSISRYTSRTVTFTGSGLSIISCTSSSNNVSVTFDSDSFTLRNSGNNTRTGTVTFSLNANATYSKVFSGWNTSPDGSGTQFLPGDVLPNSVTDLYAIWTMPNLFLDFSLGTVSSNITFSKSASEILLPYLSVDSASDLSTNPSYGTKGMYSTIYRIRTDLSLPDVTSPPERTVRTM